MVKVTERVQNFSLYSSRQYYRNCSTFCNQTCWVWLKVTSMFFFFLALSFLSSSVGLLSQLHDWLGAELADQRFSFCVYIMSQCLALWICHEPTPWPTLGSVDWHPSFCVYWTLASSMTTLFGHSSTFTLVSQKLCVVPPLLPSPRDFVSPDLWDWLAALVLWSVNCCPASIKLIHKGVN